ncbi:ankyrin repeat domain-containing protein (plasmid) [Borrelia sp. A-FGy1]|uniref:ankyrin repeat domain-containing protein n=1 Tax=Borrelia sp. A-FGy1 TaxID=2608247 RepID=UPI0015F5DDC1|nr:ankyrin repeat domain-containing protein [Borrelia sp. A-FGy1]QMU99750.1 ankyrin repeat domain-containing protein [Borrelia sp. A-FGy1]
MSNYILQIIFIFFGYIIIGIISFTIFNKNLREKIKRKLKKLNFLYYLTLFVFFIISSNLSYYFSEKQLLENLNDFEKDFFEIHKINEIFLKKYLSNLKEPIKMELMSQVKPIYTIFNSTFEKYSKNINKSPNDIKTNYNNYIKSMNIDIKNRIAILEKKILPIYNKYKLPFLNNKISDISVDKDGNIVPIIKDLKGKISDLLFYDKSYNLIPFKKYKEYEVKFVLIKNNNNYFKEILDIYYLDSNNSKTPIDYYKNNIDTIPYYIDLKENKDNFLKSIKIKNEYKSYIEKKHKLQELIKNDNLNEFKNFLEQNQKNFSLNTILSNGSPIFTYAINLKSKNIIEYMILKNFDINLVDTESKTVLHIAIIKEYDIDLIKSIVEKGGNPNIKDSFKKLPLDYASKNSMLYQYLKAITNK